MAQQRPDQNLNLYYQRVALLYQRPEIKASVEVILSVFTIGILIMFAIRPTITNIASLQKKIEDQEKILTQADNKMAKLLSAQEQMVTYQDKLGLFDDAVPDIFGYFGMIKRIELLAAKNNVNLTRLTLPASVPYGKIDATRTRIFQIPKLVKVDANNLIQAEIDFGVRGNPGDVIKFLVDLENMDRVVLITQVKISKPGASTTIRGVSLEAEGSAVFYFYNNVNK